MEEINKKQKDFWSGAGGDVWVDKQKEMDIMLNPLGNKAINNINFPDTSYNIRYRVRLRRNNTRYCQESAKWKNNRIRYFRADASKG